jgi:CheY-like chemotaxis protein
MARVLIVDDDEGIRESVRLAMEEEGYEVAEAPDGRSALDFLQASQKRWLVLLDQLMPILDGTGFLREVQKNPALFSRHVYILLTARSRISTPTLDLATSLGVSVLKKPFELEQLLELVAQAAARLGETSAE